jgi:hypothetical protein
VPQGLKIAANAVANPTSMRTTSGMNLTTPVNPLPISGVISAEMQPISVAAASPFLIKSVAVNDVNAYDEKKL